MRVLLPTVTIMEVAKVVAVSEKRLTYNGRDLRLCEKAADIAYANGIGLFPEAQGSFDVATVNAVMLGNLSNEVVREVLTSLVIKEWVDLSSLKLQKKQLMTTQYVFDNGVSDAYLLSGFEVNMLCCADALGYPSENGPFPAVCEAEDTGERESEGECAGEEDSDE